MKARIGKHFNETKNLVNKGKTSDSFAGHFAMHLEDKMKGKDKNVTINDVRNMVKMSILWGGKAISCNKSFGRLNCYLCMYERISILESIRKDGKTGVRNVSIIIRRFMDHVGINLGFIGFQVTTSPVLMTDVVWKKVSKY